MGGIPDPWTQPPTPAQLSSLCAEAAAIARSWGWQKGDISLQSVMAHTYSHLYGLPATGLRFFTVYGP